MKARVIGAVAAVVVLLMILHVEQAWAGPAYIAVDLTPSGGAYGTGSNGTQQVGWGAASGSHHALLWTGTPQSYVDLNPSGFTWSHATGASGTQQVGHGYSATDDKNALLWTGTAASCINLNPSAYVASEAYGTNGTQQVGFGAWRGAGPGPSGYNYHAMLWNGSASSYVDLNPPDFAESCATGISGTQQVGYGKGYSTNSGYHALVWNGTPNSYVDINPHGFDVSYAYGTSGTQQVGYGVTPSTVYALLWTGTAASCINLNPPGFRASQAFATNGIQQVGLGMGPDTSNNLALLWEGTADSYVDLEQFLPPGLRNSDSEAAAIDSYGNIVGWAHGHAILWVPVPEPATLSLLALGGLAAIRRRRK